METWLKGIIQEVSTNFPKGVQPKEIRVGTARKELGQFLKNP